MSRKEYRQMVEELPNDVLLDTYNDILQSLCENYDEMLRRKMEILNSELYHRLQINTK